jgi:hypothetical protein
MKIEFSIDRQHIVSLIIAVATVAGIGYAIAQSTPDPGHGADCIGPGEFAGTGTYTFPAGSTVCIGSDCVTEFTGGGSESWMDGTGAVYTMESVGIGRSNPSVDLEIYSNAGESSRIRLGQYDNTGGGPGISMYRHDLSIGSGRRWLIYNEGDGLYFWQETIMMAITNAGNIGIGTTSTSSGLKFDVEGKIGATHICDENGGNCRDISEGWGMTCPCGTCWATREFQEGMYRYWRMCTPDGWKQTSHLFGGA